MTTSLLHRVVAVGTVGLLALAGTAAAEPADDGNADALVTASQLPVDTLLDALPADAEEAGFEFAPRLLKVFGDRDERNAVVASGLDVTEHGGHDYVEVVINTQEELDLLGSLGLKYDVEIPDLIAREAQRILADSEFAAANALTDLPSGRTMYRVLGEFVTEIDELVAANGDIAKKVVVGQSVEGRDIVGIEIGEGVNDPEDGRPVFLMFGNHHAREWPSAEAPMEFAHDLIATYDAGDARTVDLLSRARTIIVPVSNPDGFEISRTQGDLIDLNAFNDQDPLGGTTVILATPGGAYKRKNCRLIDGQTQPAGPCAAAALTDAGGYGPGIDLNRNYGALWGGPGAAGQTDGDPGSVLSPIYRGPAPFSEPETAAIRELISTRQVTTLISNHTFSNLLLRPVGVEPTTEHPDGFPIGFAPDECFELPDGGDLGMQSLGEQMTAQVGYSNQFGWELYDTTGTTEDYSYNATGGFGYTFEIGPDEFHPPFENFIEEYIGSTEAADAMTTDNAAALTTSTARDCEGDDVDHDTVGGGLREAYFIALENAANNATHSVITGEAPAGAEIAVTRTGEFPLWDNSKVEDTVTTAMVVPADGEFAYHVNPSTRPFADSRAYLDPEAPEPVRAEISSESRTGTASQPPGSTNDELIDVPAGQGIESLVIDLAHTVPGEDLDIELLSPDGVVIGSSGNAPGEDEQIVFNRIGGAGIQPGTYVLRITNFAALQGGYELTISMGNFPDYEPPAELETPRTPEQWTLTCTLDGTQIDEQQVSVDRGESVDVGELCFVAASSGEPAPAPAPDAGDDEDGELAATGGGATAIALALLALGGFALAGRRRDELA